MFELFRHLRSRDEQGASAVEYGLLLAGVAALITLIVFAFGGVVARQFSNSCGTVTNTVEASSTC
jgi:pilus assembly protein Flp/PilA